MGSGCKWTTRIGFLKVVPNKATLPPKPPCRWSVTAAADSTSTSVQRRCGLVWPHPRRQWPNSRSSPSSSLVLRAAMCWILRPPGRGPARIQTSTRFDASLRRPPLPSLRGKFSDSRHRAQSFKENLCHDLPVHDCPDGTWPSHPGQRVPYHRQLPAWPHRPSSRHSLPVWQS